MVITEVGVEVVNKERKGPLYGYSSIVFDNELVVHDLKIISGKKRLFVAMPNRKLMGRCLNCAKKNNLESRYCSHCGVKLDRDRVICLPYGTPARLYADIVHPISSELRDHIEKLVLTEYEAELERAQQPGHISGYTRVMSV